MYAFAAADPFTKRLSLPFDFFAEADRLVDRFRVPEVEDRERFLRRFDPLAERAPRIRDCQTAFAAGVCSFTPC